jgi:hypothetical protein
MDSFFQSEAYLALEEQRKSCSSARVLGVESL